MNQDWRWLILRLWRRFCHHSNGWISNIESSFSFFRRYESVLSTVFWRQVNSIMPKVNSAFPGEPSKGVSSYRYYRLQIAAPIDTIRYPFFVSSVVCLFVCLDAEMSRCHACSLTSPPFSLNVHWFGFCKMTSSVFLHVDESIIQLWIIITSEFMGKTMV